MNYIYFVSYSHANGFGMIEISSEKPIETFDDVIAIKNVIKEKNGLDVVIINWIPLKS